MNYKRILLIKIKNKKKSVLGRIHTYLTRHSQTYKTLITYTNTHTHSQEQIYILSTHTYIESSAFFIFFIIESSA